MIKVRVIVEEIEEGVLPRIEERDGVYGTLLNAHEGVMDYVCILNSARSLRIGVAKEMKAGLSWMEAQEALMLGAQVTRDSYRNGVRVKYIPRNPDGPIQKPMFAIYGRAGEDEWADWRPQTDDLLAADWRILEPLEGGSGETLDADVVPLNSKMVL